MSNVVAEGRLFPSLKELFQFGTTFGLTVFAWIFFRAENLGHAYSYMRRISWNIFSIPDFIGRRLAVEIIILIGLMLIVDFWHRKEPHGLTLSCLSNKYLRKLFYFLIAFSIMVYHKTDSQEFIYFQF